MGRILWAHLIHVLHIGGHLLFAKFARIETVSWNIYLDIDVYVYMYVNSSAGKNSTWLDLRQTQLNSGRPGSIMDESHCILTVVVPVSSHAGNNKIDYGQRLDYQRKYSSIVSISWKFDCHQYQKYFLIVNSGGRLDCTLRQYSSIVYFVVGDWIARYGNILR